MQKFLIIVTLTLSLSSLSCDQSSQTTIDQSVPVLDVSNAEAPPDVNFLNQGLEQGYEAAVAAQSAADSAAWQAVADQWSNAIETLRNVPSVSSDYEKAQGKTEEYQKNLDYAISRLEASLSDKDYLRRGQNKYLADDFAGAIQDYSKAIELNSNLAQAYFNRGEAWIQLKNNDESMKNFEKAIELYEAQGENAGASIVRDRLNYLRTYGR